MDLTDDEARQLWSYVKGSRFSGTARRMVGEFCDARGWSDDDRRHAITELSERFGSSAASQ
jgi:hypothetical protein